MNRCSENEVCPYYNHEHFILFWQLYRVVKGTEDAPPATKNVQPSSWCLTLMICEYNHMAWQLVKKASKQACSQEAKLCSQVIMFCSFTTLLWNYDNRHNLGFGSVQVGDRLSCFFSPTFG